MSLLSLRLCRLEQPGKGALVIGLFELLVPFASTWKPGPVAWGIVAMYLLVAVEISSLMMKRMPKKVWRAIHMTSFGVFITGTVHGLQAGTDAGHPIYVGAAVASIVAVAFLTAYRVLGPRRGSRQPALAV